MSDTKKSRANVYDRFLAERDSILEHKWYLSEQLGKDVGFERALADWAANHRDRWLEERARKKTVRK
jgi:hypothetical protein